MYDPRHLHILLIRKKTICSLCLLDLFFNQFSQLITFIYLQPIHEFAHSHDSGSKRIIYIMSPLCYLISNSHYLPLQAGNRLPFFVFIYIYFL